MAQPPLEDKDSRIRLQKILVPTDFSSHANYALEYATYFAQRYRAQILLVHVMAPYFGGTEADVLAIPAAYYGRDLMGILQERLEELAAGLRGQDIDVDTILIMGVPFVEIVKLARRHDVDLIMISTHGRTGLGHAFIGSTTERVVRKASCPVLSVRPAELSD